MKTIKHTLLVFTILTVSAEAIAQKNNTSFEREEYVTVEKNVKLHVIARVSLRAKHEQ